MAVEINIIGINKRIAELGQTMRTIAERGPKEAESIDFIVQATRFHLQTQCPEITGESIANKQVQIPSIDEMMREMTVIAIKGRCWEEMIEMTINTLRPTSFSSLTEKH